MGAFNFAILLEPAEISPAAAFAIYLFQQNGLGYHVLVGEFDKDFENSPSNASINQLLNR